MGWSLGTNDAANAFGTAVSTRVIKYRTAVIIIAILVIVGAFLQGEGNIGKLSELAQSNKVVATGEDVSRAIEQDAVESLRWKSAIKAAIIFGCAGLTVFVMSYLKFPVSANQSITGAIIGWGLFHANYSDPAVLGAVIGAGLVSGVKNVNFGVFKRIAIAWVSSPTVAGLLTYLVALATQNYLA